MGGLTVGFNSIAFRQIRNNHAIRGIATQFRQQVPRALSPARRLKCGVGNGVPDSRPIRTATSLDEPASPRSVTHHDESNRALEYSATPAICGLRTGTTLIRLDKGASGCDSGHGSPTTSASIRSLTRSSRAWISTESRLPDASVYLSWGEPGFVTTCSVATTLESPLGVRTTV